MNLLILGGTRFVGRAIVEAALGRGHSASVFHRGRHEARFSREVEALHGDRGGDLAALHGRRWDAVIDTSGYAYPHVRASARLLADAVEHYVFVSTIAVYADWSALGIGEDAPLKGADRETLEWTGPTYGPMKVACEEAVRASVPERHLIVRPGIIVGPDDYTDRFPYWCRRVAHGGEVLCAGDPARPVQWIDARDLGEWVVRATEERLTGPFNAAGPAAPTSMLEMLEGLRRATGSDARFTWAADEWLQRHGSEPGRDFPFHAPAERTGVFAIDSGRAVGAGLRFRPLGDTAQDTLAWDRQRTEEERRAGLSPEREQELLSAWRDG
jgi:2'-hydroxyisoflavone reductase